MCRQKQRKLCCTRSAWEHFIYIAPSTLSWHLNYFNEIPLKCSHSCNREKIFQHCYDSVTSLVSSAQWSVSTLGVQFNIWSNFLLLVQCFILNLNTFVDYVFGVKLELKAFLPKGKNSIQCKWEHHTQDHPLSFAHCAITSLTPSANPSPHPLL